MNWLTRIFSRRPPAAPRPSATRLYLEQLENRLVPATANIVATDIVDNGGLWCWEGGMSWQQSTASYATQDAVDARGDVAAEIPGRGVWR